MTKWCSGGGGGGGVKKSIAASESKKSGASLTRSEWKLRQSRTYLQSCTRRFTVVRASCYPHLGGCGIRARNQFKGLSLIYRISGRVRFNHTPVYSYTSLTLDQLFLSLIQMSSSSSSSCSKAPNSSSSSNAWLFNLYTMLIRSWAFFF